MLNLNHKKLDVYAASLALVKEIYGLTSSFPADEKFGLISQLRRASISVPSNIAVGSSRKTLKERIRFYQISRSSLVEIDTQIEIALVLEYLNKSDIKQLTELTNKVFAMLTNMMKT
ncbi:MAG: four helix bundle protein [Balneolaceae bacterium]|nr:four helix bundle protein [Balneolaceae bacterium]